METKSLEDEVHVLHPSERIYQNNWLNKVSETASYIEIN
jgi:hypothetical protein